MDALEERRELVTRRAERRDAGARELFVAHYARLAGWVLRLVEDEATSHEIAAEAFTRLLPRWASVDDPRAYLYVTAANLVKDHWRRLDRERGALAKVATPPGPPGPDERPSLRDVVDRLPERLRVVVLLHYYADLPVAEVARALGIADGSVKRRLWEARALLHEALEGAR
jgi:RNA polymerase sigma-70 factor (ECF subfamily)